MCPWQLAAYSTGRRVLAEEVLVGLVSHGTAAPRLLILDQILLAQLLVLLQVMVLREQGEV